MRSIKFVAGFCTGLCLMAVLPVRAQQLADTTQLAALGTWPTVVLNDSSFTAENTAPATPVPASTGKLKAFVDANATEGYMLTDKENLKKLNLFIKTDPGNAEAYANRGKARYQLNDTGGAIKDFSAALKIKPAQTEIYYLRGLAWFKTKKYPDAIEDLTKALEAGPTVEGLIYRAKAKAQMFDYRGAEYDNSKALELDPENAEALYNRAVARFYLKDYYAAIADFSAVLELKKHLNEVYFYRGLARHYTGDKNGGCLDLSRAGELGFDTAYDEIKSLCL